MSLTIIHTYNTNLTLPLCTAGCCSHCSMSSYKMILFYKGHLKTLLIILNYIYIVYVSI